MTRAECHRQFIKEMHAISSAYSPVQIFADVVRAMQILIACGLQTDGEIIQAMDTEYSGFERKYGDGWKHASDCMAITVDALDIRREDFLGHILEDIGAANVRNGQFFTPISVSRMMAEINFTDVTYTPGTPISIYDNSGGAGVTLIEGAEYLIRERNVPQRDIIVIHGDIDGRACAMAYVQFSLLGYPAIVCHQDGLSLQMYEEPYYTPGWYLHCMPMRGISGERYITRPRRKAE